MGDPTMLGDLYYEISGGQLHLRSHVLICYAWSSDGDLFTAQSLPLVEGEVDENGNETATAQMLQTAGWVVTPPYYASLLMENGQRVPTATADEFSDELIRRNDAFTRDMEDMPFESMDGSVWLNGDWPAGDRVAALLTDYASAGPAYDYPVVTGDDDAYVRAVADAVAAAVGGEITAIYKLSDGVYYVPHHRGRRRQGRSGPGRPAKRPGGLERDRNPTTRRWSRRRWTNWPAACFPAPTLPWTTARSAAAWRSSRRISRVFSTTWTA